jgi:phosphoribosylanthranilate isomerase
MSDPLSPGTSRAGTRIKICGIRDVATAKVVHQAGADAIGLVRYPGSPRHLDDAQARAIATAVPHDIAVVRVVVDPGDDELSAATGWIQLHGEETEATAALAARSTGQVIRGFAFSPQAVQRWDACKAVDLLLIDGPGKGAGTPFDHRELLGVLESVSTPVIIAGGLTPDTVGDVVRLLHPFGVDVSSGVETQRGIKDPGAIRAFCEAVRAADSEG